MWALRNVSLEVQEGETIGVVGNNGAGKSTLLKLLSRITAPTTGEIRIRGRLSALIEIGSGFHPELTGRENIFLNASMLGMTRSETSRKLDSIIEFAGLSEYIDVPVKRYSSGMYVRLGFSIAAHLDPDIILLDEILAVGDLAFQAKCLDHIERLRADGRTIMLISHDIGAIQRVCDRAILLHQGQIIMDSTPTDVADRYQQMSMGPLGYELTDQVGKKSATCLYISFASDKSEDAPRTGYPMVARFGFHAQKPLEDVSFNILIYWPSGYLCTQLTTAVSESKLRIPAGAGEIEFHCPVLEIQPGWYRVDVSIESNGACLDSHQRCSVIRVRPGKMVSGDFYMDSTWRITHNPSLRTSSNSHPDLPEAR
jgi:ABC-type polysaccharide/polyol phosphate transport system ATPase subunit